MIADRSLPRPEDFGLNADFLENEPVLIIEQRRGLLCAVAMTVLVGTAVAFTAWKTASVSAALFLAPILVAAWLVLLLPLVVGCVSLAGKIEESWRSSRDPEFRSWMRYRRALSECESKGNGRPSFERHMWWLNADPGQLQDRVVEIFGSLGVVEILDRTATGADLVFDDGGRRTVVRCESGSKPAETGVARELAMARIDLRADDAILIVPAGASPALQRYVETHPMHILDAQALAASEHGSILRAG